MPTNEHQLKYVVLCYLKSEDFNYPNPTREIFDEVRQQYSSIEKAYEYLGTLPFDRVLEDIASR